jgi:hemoglobin
MDITTRADIETLVNTFYEQVKKDDTIGYIFSEAIGMDWSHHLPRMYSFWALVLLDEPGYTGNSISKHIELDKKTPLHDPHYERWIALWNATVDKMFSGPKADEAKKRAKLMKDLIKFKVEFARTGKSLQ